MQCLHWAGREADVSVWDSSCFVIRLRDMKLGGGEGPYRTSPWVCLRRPRSEIPRASGADLHAEQRTVPHFAVRVDDTTGLLGRQVVQLGAVVVRHGLSFCCPGRSFVDVSASLGNVESFRRLGEVVTGGLRSLVSTIGIKAGLQLIVWQLHAVCGSKVVGSSEAGDWQL